MSILLQVLSVWSSKCVVCCKDVQVSEVRTTSSSLVSAEELASSCCLVGADSQSVDTGYVSYSTRSLYVAQSLSSLCHFCQFTLFIHLCNIFVILPFVELNTLQFNLSFLSFYISFSNFAYFIMPHPT